MAEFGVISGSLGIVSLAIQVANSVKKLKDFLNSVKEAPDEIKYTIRQIEALDLVLSDRGADEDDQNISEAASIAMGTCKMFLNQAAGNLQIIVKELDLAISQRKRMGSFKAVLKQSTLDKLKQRLRDAQDLLVLSNQYYLQALERRRYDMQKQWAEIQADKLSNLEIHVTQCAEVVRSLRQDSAISASLVIDRRPSESDETSSNDTDPAGPKDECKQLATSYKDVSYLLKRQKQTLARLQFPSWLQLTSLCLEVCGQRSLYGTSLDVKVYRNVDKYAPIMQYARQGDVQAIQEMFSKGTATPHDRWGDSETVLNVAAAANKIEVCRLLMQNGAHQHARIAYFRVLNFGNPLRDLKTRLELIRTLAKAVDDDDFFDFQPEGSAIDGFHGYPGMLSWILNNIIGYNYQKATVEDRTKLAIHLCARTGQPRAAPLVRFLLPEEQAISKMCHYTDYNCRTLLSSAAWALGEQSLRATQSSQTPIAHQRIKTSSDSFKFNAQVESDCLQDLLSLMKDLIIAGSNLHTTAHRFVAYTPPNPGETPLVSLFSGFSHLRSQCMDFSLVRSSQVEYVHLNLSAPTVIDVLVPVVLWIELLFDAGIDLSEYGRKEQELYREGRATSHCWFTVWRRALWLSELDRRYYFEKRFSIRFKYGPKPSDWQFWLIEEMDNSLAEFWDMVDHPERSMPGAWDDRFDDSD